MRALCAEGLSLRQLRLFEAVGRINSVHRAAEECNLSQPAVTQALAKLEEVVGVSLLERRSSGSYLNDSGQILYRRVVRFFAQMEEAILELGRFDQNHSARIIANRFSLSQVSCLLAIVDTGCFNRAADSLEIKGDSLQRILRTVEKNLGSDIICSTPNGKSLNETGLRFGRKLKLALQEISWGLEEVDVALETSTARIAIGAMPFGGCVLLASVLEDFLAIHPDANVKIANEKASELLRSLESGNVDFVIGLEQQMRPGEFQFEALGQTPYSVVARKGHPLLQKHRLTIDDLLKYQWVIGTPGSHRRACFDRLFDVSEAPRASVATCALPIIRHLLRTSDRLTLMTSYELGYDAQSLVPLSFDGIETIPSLGITSRVDWLPKKVHRDFIGLLRDRIAEMAEQPQRRKSALRVVAAL